MLCLFAPSPFLRQALPSHSLARPKPRNRCPLPTVKPFTGAAALVGRVEADSACESGKFEAWLSQDKTLFYQVDVSQHGSFELHVLPGHYQLAITTTGGCFAETEIEAKPGEVKTLTVKPAPVQKKTSFLDLLIPSAFGSMCYQCDLMAAYQAQMEQQAYFQQMAMTSFYGNMAYTNYGFPGPMRGAYVNGGMFPGGGNIGMDKPVLYFDGKDGTDLSVRVNLADGGNWLVAVPSHGEQAWHGKLQSNHFVSADGGEFNDLYYDYRTDSAVLQDSTGFCTKRGDLMPKLKTALRQSGFKPEEIRDFEQYWTPKIPKSDRYCIYPQTSKELQKVARLEIEPKPTSLTQLVFTIQVKEALTGGPEKFAKPPTQTWKPEIATRIPAADGAVRAREWGVGFVMVGKP